MDSLFESKSQEAGVREDLSGDEVGEQGKPTRGCSTRTQFFQDFLETTQMPHGIVSWWDALLEQLPTSSHSPLTKHCPYVSKKAPWGSVLEV